MRALPSPQPMYLRTGSAHEHGGLTPTAPGSTDQTVFAFLHPGAEPLKETAVLICPPFGWEDMCCYRIRREWAEHLARAGYTTLRIDLPGSGDSEGSPSDPGRLEAWTQAVDGATGWLRSHIGARRVAVIGLGLGGMVSCRAALQGTPIDELILWSVPARGRRLLRELRAFTAFEVANALEAGESAPDCEPVEEGALATNGYLLSAETVAELERLDLGEVELASPATTRRALLLGRDGMNVEKALPAVLERAGAEVTIANGPGYGAMMVEPQEARAPLGVFALVSDWLQEGASLHVAPATTPVSAMTQGSPRACEEMVIEHAGVALRERPVFVDGPNGPLFGVLTEPLAGRRDLTALLLNAGPQRRVGPNRMWVDTARRWAAQGVSALRMDLGGIGDSDGDPTVLARVTEFYQPAYVEQARAALEALAEWGLPPRFVTLGLCAGCYWSVQAALTDERVVAAIMLNPRTLVFDKWRHSVRHTRGVRDKMLLGSTWRKVLRGDINLARHIELGRTFIGQAVAAPLRARRKAGAAGNGTGPVREPIEELFDSLRDRGQRGLLLFTGKEILRRELTQNGVLDRMDRWPNLQLKLMGTSADTHTLTPVWLQRQVYTVIDSVLEDELERLPEAATLSDLAAA